ncbi:MAG: hypothetical protein QXV17_14630 [Candidatus Micrarchaeaceae archaeon]
MARKSRRLLVAGVLTPADLSRMVIGNYISGARTNISIWQSRYAGGIQDYITSLRKQEMARAKLETWYNIFLTEVYPRLSGVYTEAKRAYYSNISKMTLPPLARAVTPPAPAVAPETA